jgi:hypothetical protein
MTQYQKSRLSRRQELERLREALSSAPRPEAALKNYTTWTVEYMDWFFKVRGAALSNATDQDRSSTAEGK